MTRQDMYDYLGITVGSILISLALVIFLVPNRIAAGGVSGLATVLFHLFNWPVGTVILALNVPLFLLGVKELGAKFGFKTLYGIIVLSVATDLLTPHLAFITDDLLLVAIYGGGLAGVGLGIVFKSRGTTGGTDLVAQIINKYTGLSPGKGLLIIDFFVISLAGIVFNLELALYALISLAITSMTIDLVQEGLTISKGAFIISDAAEAIRADIINELDRGVTVLNGRGGFTEENKDILLCIISRSEVSDLKNVVHTIDEDAFVIITEVHEVLGEGFKENIIEEV
ncbi:YitT family protein [Natroniella sulfidigena]|uniref:YitT family protein n=1 Tax=Natroniella sulfidigena TaxID=723921 RepID=UPI00200A433E|nr:YitT family protein [Natroniella sulfidigena]MCK8816000.1 YitT family protein [Natroniella sulfidigena]